MCGLPDYESPHARRVQLACDVGNGQARVRAHAERLRTENPRLYAALQPLLADMDAWQSSVAKAIGEVVNEL